MKVSLKRRFWSRVKKTTKCWEWQGGKFWDGYPAIWINGRNERGNRIAFQIQNGPLPSNLDALHKCDNPGCVRGSHLFAGTRAENCVDMGRKGRAEKGSKRWNARLSESAIVQIFKLRRRGRLYREIAKHFDVHPVTIGDVIRGTTWRHVNV